jgi:hypothetical protein
MSIRGMVGGLSSCIVAVALAAICAPATSGEHPAPAGSNGSGRNEGRQHEQHTAELAKVVRETTKRFRDVNVAMAEGYQLMFGCVSGPDDGAMGLHYVTWSWWEIRRWMHAALKS